MVLPLRVKKRWSCGSSGPVGSQPCVASLKPSRVLPRDAPAIYEREAMAVEQVTQ